MRLLTAVKVNHGLENSFKIHLRLESNLRLYFRDVGNAPRHVFETFLLSFLVRHQDNLGL
jgi:hypothetical protein